MQFCSHKSFSVIMIRAGEEQQAASLHSPAAVAAQLQRSAYLEYEIFCCDTRLDPSDWSNIC
jgi:hypothetical protein